MFCESRSTVLEKLKKDGILGEYNEVLNTIEFEKFNKDFTRYVELKYNLNTDGEFAFSTYETQTRFPYSSKYYRDDIQTTIYAQVNEPLFEALDDERMKADIKEELGDYTIVTEPDVEFPEDESLNPMFMKEPSYLQNKFNTETRKAMLSFMEGLNIKVETTLDEIISSDRELNRYKNFEFYS